MKNCSHKRFKKANRLSGQHTKRWLKLPQDKTTVKYIRLEKLSDKAASIMFNLNYTGTPKLRDRPDWIK